MEEVGPFNLGGSVSSLSVKACTCSILSGPDYKAGQFSMLQVN